ncbi:MAG TPA: TonB-dependent receptor [Spongiibacteraceae bacterium]|nr:TonB-dependent receptor [Spongiibacteraceae bacterium]
MRKATTSPHLDAMPLRRKTLQLTALAAAIASALTAQAEPVADSGNKPQQIVVTGRRELQEITATGDASQQLEDKPGINFYSAGGASRLPVLHGLNDDRIKLLIDGAPSTSACANHMNPALSYIDASQVKTVELIAGITPVSLGGDSIAGTIVIDSAAPKFAANSNALYSAATLSTFYRSINNNVGLAASAVIADQHFSVGYNGAIDRAQSYEDGHGDKVLDTLYKTENHQLTFGMQGEQQTLTLKLGYQYIPYQGYANQFMDMVGNRSDSAKLQYTRAFGWGEFVARAYWQQVTHEMGFFTSEKTGVMPMNTEGKDTGYSLQGNIALSAQHTLRIGHDLHRFRLDDWWPAVPGSMMMGPLDYINITDGQRDRIGVFAESDYQWNDRWSTLLGVRSDTVKMDAGDVQPYSWMQSMMNVDRMAALTFNARNHARTDTHIDATALARYEPGKTATYEFGYARKTRSPNLYERYSWGTSRMATLMVGWFGDANGYIGNIDLEPETAHTLSATFDWHDADRTLWQAAVTPYYTYVDNYIDVDRLGTLTLPDGTERAQLQFANHDATLYGVDASGQVRAWENAPFGRGVVKAIFGYTHAKRNDTGDSLYHIMPANTKVSLEQTLGGWTNIAEVQWVARKSRVQDLRLEPEAASYTLVNLRTAYDWNLSAQTMLRIDAGIRNLFDRYYELPLGGVSVAEWKNSGDLRQIAGPGRSFEVGATLKF